ncbi:MAG: ClpXP protease specificity-enhancing factor [Gammaproteobacteria bacterium]
MSDEQTPQRPYLYRALHEWMTDNGHTPHIVANASDENTVVPADYIDDDRIVLNVSYSATHNLMLGNDAITFQARFGGNPFEVYIPEHAVLAIYARESGEGMVFADPGDADLTAADGDEHEHEHDENDEDDGAAGDKPDRSHLRVIK